MRYITIILIFLLFSVSLGGCYVYTTEPPPPAVIIYPEGPPPPPPPAGEVGPAR